ncbi:lipopolysaccharide assembly protein LapB [Geobacter sp. SVR]|uniref:tetratricopeptide repeat protein n=1 Tax=Geobacter sp. SVR TaxID=2495594 RepID=UPI00143EF92C|nr:glycosyltransferase family 39 protein [Geobacter sp. SVR]BCS52128.1 hypothetical protein GSVR_04360 [Geobacter sp. SVR]GCF86583.1 hypothetical protein GSbR_31830 [Geobacter sp. SVR]
MIDFPQRRIYALGIITILVAAVYGSILGHGFVWDDFDIIANNPLTSSLANIPKFFVSEDMSDGPTGYYRPLTYVSFTIDRAVWGLNPIGFTLTNILLHIATALLFYRVVARLFSREDLALAAALLFALHPIAGETVNFHAGGRNTLLCACFALLSLLFHVNKRYLPALACFVPAIFSKEFALLLPVIFIMHDRVISSDKPGWRTYAPYGAAICVYLSLRAFTVQSAGIVNRLDLTGAVWTAPQVYVSYLWNMLNPFNIKVMYDVADRPGILSLLSDIGLLALIAGAVYRFRGKRELLYAAIVFFLFLLPVSTILPLGITKMADRYAYFASFGFSLALAWAICSTPRKVALALLGLLLITYGALDIHRNGYWRNEQTLFSRMVADAPAMSIGFQRLGIFHFDRGEFAAAEPYLMEAAGKKDLNVEMLMGSASMFIDMGKPAKALPFLARKLEQEPANLEALVMSAKIREEMGDQAMAQSFRNRALAINPLVFSMLTERALALCRQGEELTARGDLAGAERLFRAALRMEPTFVPALIDLGGIMAEKGNLNGALTYFEKARSLESGNPAIPYNLALLYKMMNRQADAEKEEREYRRMKKNR